jgi:YVTN family beta-propeller protein
MSFLSTNGLWLRRRAAEGAVASIRKCLVAVLGLVLTVAAHAATQDITSQFAITRSGLVLNRATNTFDSTITLKNTSGAPVLAPISGVVSGLPNSVVLANKTGQTADGKPYVSPMPAGTVLQSGATLSFVLKFADPQRVTFTSILQILYTVPPPPPGAPSLISVVATGGTSAYLVGRADGLTNQSITLRAYSAASCVFGTLVGGVPGTPVATMTDDSGYFGASVLGVNPGAFVTMQVTSPSASPASTCLISARDNDSWPKAFVLEGSPVGAQDFIDAPGKARWYRFSITPGQSIQVALTGLPADYDLAVFNDIAQTFANQFTPGSATTVDLLKLTAEYAPTIFSPTIFSPTIFSPTIFSSTNFSAATFSPTIFSPTIFSPTIFSPTIFSATEIAQAFSTAQTRSVIAVSPIAGTAAKSLVVNTWNSTGNFYVRVAGHGGAFNTSAPFTLSISKGPTTCTAVTDITLTPRAPVMATGLKTVMLTDSSVVALDATLPEPDGATLRTKLAAFAQRSEVGGVVVDVAGDARVSALKQQAANNAACPFAVNLVAQEIKGIVDSYRANPLQYVVIVGNDAAIPFFRSPDESTLGQEVDYVPPVQSNSESQASLSLDFVLSQDAYGSNTALSLPSNDFPVPGLAVGRLVETATEIGGVIDAYVAANGVVVPGSSLVTGYDFLAQPANAVETELASGIGAAGAPMDTLITPDGVSPQDSRPFPAGPWTATDLAGKLFGVRHDVIFLAGHFSANSALAADFSTSLVTTEVAASTTDFTNSIVFSAGCHAGYNLVDSDAIPGVTLPLDWAQVFARKKATLIAGTGYQYGDTDFIEYSDQIYLNFARELRAGTGAVAVGAALVAAKLDYLATTPDIRGIPEKSLLETTLFGLPMLGVNMPSGRGADPGNGGTITPVAVASGPAQSLGLETYDLNTAPTLTAHAQSLTKLGGGPNVNATWLSGPDGVVSNPGEPVLPLAALNVTPTDPTLVLRGIGFRGGSYVDSAPLYPFSGAPTTELRGVHVPFISPVFYPGRMWSPNYFGALAGSGGTELLVTPTQHIVASATDGTSTRRMYTGVNFRLYYSGNLSQAALSDAPSIVSVDAEPNAGGVLFTAQVTGDPAAAIYQVWVTYTSDGANAWTPVDLGQCVAPLPAACGTTADSRLWSGRLASVPTNLKYVVQAASGVGLVALDDNRGAYYGLGGATPEATTPALVAPPTSATVGDSVSITTKLTFAGVPVAGKTVIVTIGGTTQLGTTGADGSVTVKLPVDVAPGSYMMTVAFAGDATFQPSSTTTTFVVAKAASSLAALAPAGATLTGTLAGKTEALQQEAVSFSVTGPGGSTTIFANTDNLGRATLPPPGLPAGTYAVTQAAFGGDATFAATNLALAQQFIVPKTAQSIEFDPLADVNYGAPAFPVFATASSLLPASFAASGTCTVAGNMVQVGAVGSCTITASQAGDSNYLAAAPVARTFTISSATQAITFGAAPSSVTVGQGLVFVSATSSSPTAAPSTMPITFTSLTPAICTMGGAAANASLVNLVAPGQCTIAATQPGDPNYNTAPQATQSFTVGAAGTPPAMFTVTNLNDRGAGSLRAAIASANATAPGPNMVNFAPGLTGTIVLTTGAIQISRGLFIDGPGVDNLTIDGNSNDRIFTIGVTFPACPTLEPGPDYLVSIRRLRLTNGSRGSLSDQSGGAIYTKRSLLLDSMIIDNNTGVTHGGGVAFWAQFPGQLVSITNSQFLNNSGTELIPPSGPNPSSNVRGGALSFQDQCTTSNGTISDRPSVAPLFLIIVNSEFSGNYVQPVTLGGLGGAISLYALADVTISDTVIVDNHVDAPNPPLTTRAYHGGAFEGLPKSLRIERSEIAENSVTDVTADPNVTRSGGIYLYNDMVNRQGPGDAMAARIVNSTVSSNVSPSTAGAMLANGNVALELDNTTVNGNSAAPTRTGGVVLSIGTTFPVSANNETPPTLKLVSSILANNSSTGGDVAFNNALVPSFGINAFNSLIQKPCTTCTLTSIVISGPGNFIGADPMVGPLQFNGGLTRTHLLMPGSPAIDTGSNDFALTTDQRAFGFVRASGAAPDMGAYEGSSSLPLAAGTYVDLNLGLIGTSFLFDPTTFTGTIPFVTVTGPPSWNAGNSFSCVRYQPQGAQPVDDGAPFAYFTTATGNLLVVDTATNGVTATVGVGTNPYSAVVNPAGTRVYASNFGDNTVSVVDASTNAVIATVAVGAGPQGLAVNSSGSRVYVASFTAGSVSVIDAGTNSVITAIPVAAAVDVVVNHAGTRLFAADGAGVAIVDTATNLVIGSISRGALSSFGTIAISNDDTRLYAWSNGSASVAVIDIGTSSIVATIPIASVFATDGIAVDPSGAPVYQSNGSSVSEIDPATNSVVQTVPFGTAGSGVNGVAVTADGKRVYAATASGVRTFDTATETVTPIATGAVRALGHFLGSGPRSVLENIEDRSICWTFALPVTGSYTAQGTAGSTAFAGTVSLDAANQLGAPQITSLQVGAGSVSLAWTPPAGARSFLVRVNPVPFTGITGEKIVSRGSSSATLTGLNLTSGANYQATVFAFSQDLLTPDVFAGVFNVSTNSQNFIGP